MNGCSCFDPCLGPSLRFSHEYLEARGPAWTIFGTPMVERWIAPRFLSALLTETNIDERPGYGERKFLERYQLRYLAAGGQIYRQRVVRGAVVFHEAL